MTTKGIYFWYILLTSLILSPLALNGELSDFMFYICMVLLNGSVYFLVQGIKFENASFKNLLKGTATGIIIAVIFSGLTLFILIFKNSADNSKFENTSSYYFKGEFIQKKLLEFHPDLLILNHRRNQRIASIHKNLPLRKMFLQSESSQPLSVENIILVNGSKCLTVVERDKFPLNNNGYSNNKYGFNLLMNTEFNTDSLLSKPNIDYLLMDVKYDSTSNDIIWFSGNYIWSK